MKSLAQIFNQNLIFITTSILFSPFIYAADAEKYRGNIVDFEKFSNEFKKNWPEPSQIGYLRIKNTANVGIRYAHWTTSATVRRGVVVHFNGRTEFIEKNIYSYIDILHRGYDVWTLDWRGQGLSSRGEAPKQMHDIDDFQTYVLDAEQFINEVVKLDRQPGKKILLAHSMGGQIALRYLIKNNKESIFDFAVLGSPLLRLPEDQWWVRVGNLIKISVGLGQQCVATRKSVWKSNFKPGQACELVKMGNVSNLDFEDPTEALKYTNDAKKQADIDCLIERSSVDQPDQPDLRLACPTSQWFRAALNSTDQTMNQAKELNTPTLIIRTVNDAAVDNDGQTEFCKKASVRCESISEVSGKTAGHELMIEVEPIRQKFFLFFDQFTESQPLPLR
jgi:lysophospholipase